MELSQILTSRKNRTIKKTKIFFSDPALATNKRDHPLPEKKASPAVRSGENLVGFGAIRSEPRKRAEGAGEEEQGPPGEGYHCWGESRGSRLAGTLDTWRCERWRTPGPPVMRLH